MSGSRDAHAGQQPQGDSSPRQTAGQNPQNNLESGSLASIATPLPPHTLRDDTIQRLGAHRRDYRQWIADLKRSLSDCGRAICDSQSFERLKGVYHSTSAHSRAMSHVDNTRYDHCIHAAHTARVLGRSIGLTPYEVNVLELVMLQHDTHRLGSHALDRVFASMPGSPKIDEWWAKGDYHEYHGALIVADDPTLREILGGYLPDVLAILAFDDKRPTAERDRDYGPVQPTLTPERIKALHHLKDELDRCSYLKLDYIRSGLQTALITQVVRDVERHESTLSSRGDELQIHIEGDMGGLPFDDVAKWRQFYRANIATLPVGCLAEKVIFHDGIWERASENHTRAYLESPKLYKFVRDQALAGRYDKILSGEAQQFLRAAESEEGLSVEDVYAPLATLTFADFSDVRGRTALREHVPPGLAYELCGVPRADMTLFEAELRNALKGEEIKTKVHVLISNDFGKTLKYTVSERGGRPEERVVFSECPPQLLRVIVVARAIDSEGEIVNLSSTKAAVESFLGKSGYLNGNGMIPQVNLNIFCESNDPTVFSEWANKKMDCLVPEWMRVGGCGVW